MKLSDRILTALFGPPQPPAVKPPRPHPMACFICGEPGMHPIIRGKFTGWLCESDYPPFLRKDGTRVSVPTLAGDPRG